MHVYTFSIMQTFLNVIYRSKVVQIFGTTARENGMQSRLKAERAGTCVEEA